MEPNKTNSKLYGLVFLLLILLWQSHSLVTSGWSLFQNINLIFHEAGHTLFFWGPHLFTVFMGSGFELVVPVCVTFYFYYSGQKYGTIFGLWWIGTALWSIGTYAGDALDRSLPLIGGIDPVYHDWYILLLEWKLLYSAETIGSNIYALGSICVVGSIVWLIYEIYRLFHV